MLIERVIRFSLVVAAVVFLALAVGFGGYTAVFLHRAETAQATVVALEERMNMEDGTIKYCPRFNFTSADHRTFSIASSTGSNPPRFTPGQQVQVIYDPANPSHARIHTFLQIWFLPLVFAAAGVACLLGYKLLTRFSQNPDEPAPQP